MIVSIGSADGVTISVEGAVGRITLDRVERLNVITFAGLRRIIDGARFLSAQHDIKVVVLAGAGGIFTAGMDLADYVPILDDPVAIHAGAELGASMCDALEAIEPITVAVVEGHCVGGGVLMAASCDLRLAAADASFSIPELKVGVPFTWRGVPRLMREMGPGPAREMILTGRVFDAVEAQQAGLIGRVVTTGGVEDAVAELLGEITARSRASLVSTKRWMRAAVDSLVDAGSVGDDSRGLVEAMADAESVELMRRYLDGLGVG